jgi:hypothetical protein
MNVKRKTRDIQTRKKKCLDILSIDTDTLDTSPYQRVQHSALNSFCLLFLEAKRPGFEADSSLPFHVAVKKFIRGAGIAQSV